jgi:hypothetical protein
MSVVPFLNLNDVKSLIVYHLDDAMAVPGALQPEQIRNLESAQHLEITDADTVQAAYDAIRQGKPAADRNEPDVRWGAIFLSAQREPLFAAYVDRFGVQGALDERAVCFAYPTFLRWLRGIFIA